MHMLLRPSQLLPYLGPACGVRVGSVDPATWTTDIGGGAPPPPPGGRPK